LQRVYFTAFENQFFGAKDVRISLICLMDSRYRIKLRRDIAQWKYYLTALAFPASILVNRTRQKIEGLFSLVTLFHPVALGTCYSGGLSKGLLQKGIFHDSMAELSTTVVIIATFIPME